MAGADIGKDVLRGEMTRKTIDFNIIIKNLVPVYIALISIGFLSVCINTNPLTIIGFLVVGFIGFMTFLALIDFYLR